MMKSFKNSSIKSKDNPGEALFCRDWKKIKNSRCVDERTE